MLANCAKQLPAELGVGGAGEGTSSLALWASLLGEALSASQSPARGKGAEHLPSCLCTKGLPQEKRVSSHWVLGAGGGGAVSWVEPGGQNSLPSSNQLAMGPVSSPQFPHSPQELFGL